jgi:hypothetical protein
MQFDFKLLQFLNYRNRLQGIVDCFIKQIKGEICFRAEN